MIDARRRCRSRRHRRGGRPLLAPAACRGMARPRRHRGRAVGLRLGLGAVRRRQGRAERPPAADHPAATAAPNTGHDQATTDQSSAVHRTGRRPARRHRGGCGGFWSVRPRSANEQPDGHRDGPPDGVPLLTGSSAHACAEVLVTNAAPPRPEGRGAARRVPRIAEGAGGSTPACRPSLASAGTARRPTA